MKPFTLTGVSPDGHVGEVWACGECMRTTVDEDAATTCCEPYTCKECGALTEKKYYTICDACHRKRDEADEQKLIAAATVVQWADYDHEYVCIGDDSFQDVDDWEMDGEPAWAWACKPAEKLRLDAMRILEAGPLDDYHEDAVDDLDVDSLQKLLDAWCEAQQTTWFERDVTRRVVLPLPTGPCANCGHMEYHCPAGGCNAVIDGEWCECEGYVPAPPTTEAIP